VFVSFILGWLALLYLFCLDVYIRIYALIVMRSVSVVFMINTVGSEVLICYNYSVEISGVLLDR
jgi:uncharacterized MAPEG superfamily protein